MLLNGTVVAAAMAAPLLSGIALAPPAHAAGPSTTATGDGRLQLLGQSPFVASGQNLSVHLGVTAPSPDTRLALDIYPRLTTRSDFAVAQKGRPRGLSAYDLGPSPLGSFPADPAGGIDIAIPVNPRGDTGPLRGFTTRDDSAVYPFQVRLVDGQGDTVGAALTSFFVYASAAEVTALGAPPGVPGGFPRLDVALTVPVHQPPSLAATGRSARLGSTSAAAVATVATALAAHGTVPLTLAATPQTLDSLAAGSATDRATLATLATVVTGGADEVALSSYAAVSMPAMVGAGLGSEVTAQVTAGSAALASALHRAPADGVWTANGPLDQTTLESLTALGVTQLVVPGNDLSSLPDGVGQTTLGAPTELATRSGSRLKVIESDAGLAGYFTNTGDQVLAANQLLGELAMIQLETPGLTRGVAVVPPASWKGNAEFLSVLLSGLSGNPLLAPVTTGMLFAAVPMAVSGGAPVVRTLTAVRPTVPAFPDATSVRSARAAADVVGSIFPDDRSRSGPLGDLVLTAESEELSSPQRELVAGAVTAALADLRRHISLLGSSSVTLTARDGGVPITVISNGVAGAQVRLRLSSDKLTFRAFNPHRGHCSAGSAGAEVCVLTLGSEATTLKVPVVARASGVFTLDVSLSSPDGSVLLSDNRDTVRSTAFSGVGVVLIVVAGLGLASWWIRNLRHGRRALDLVPADADGEECTADGSLASPDEAIAEFFATPAPVYPPASAGPNTTVGRAVGDGRGRAG